MSGWGIKCSSCKRTLNYHTSGTYSTTSGASISGPCWTTNDGYYTTNFPHSCKECHVKSTDTAVELQRKNEKLERKNEELEREIEALKANVDFLSHSFSSSHDDHPRSFPLFSDVALVASDDSPDAPIPANKFVLASHSPVFKAMLETAMEESISGIIKMSDVTYGSLHAFVKYLYTADVCLDVKIASDLLILAEKYQVKHLKEHCERYLVSNLNWDNSILNYVFACKHSAGKLLEASLSIITNNMDKFMNTNEYGEIIRKDLSLLVGIFEAYMIKQVKNGV
ncbi:hypothetical protein Dimus_036349 [Dionaea muscipula]